MQLIIKRYGPAQVLAELHLYYKVLMMLPSRMLEYTQV
jgi:hypothetical protein